MLERPGRAWPYLLLLLTYAWFYQGSDPNQSTRYFLARAIAERGAPDITPDHAKTIDKGEFNGRYYSDKAPGIALLAVAPVWLMDRADRLFHLEDGLSLRRVRLHLLSILLAALPGVLAVFCLERTLLQLGATAALARMLALGYGLGTIAFPFATVLFGHAAAAALVAAALACAVAWCPSPEGLTPRRAAALGALAGLSVLIEYPTAMLHGLLALYALSSLRPRSRLVALAAMAAGALPFIAIHVAFSQWAYGAPFQLGYQHVSEPLFRANATSGLLGVGGPSWRGLHGVLFGSYRGLFFLCPWLILSIAGVGDWLASGERRRELWLSLAAIVGYIAFNASYYAWDGGGSTGPRHFIPALPFLVLPIFYFVRAARWRRWLCAGALALSAAMMLASTAVLVQQPQGDPRRVAPLAELILPALARGQLSLNPQEADARFPRSDAAYNLGTLAGLSPRASLLPLLVAWLVAGALALRGARRNPA